MVSILDTLATEVAKGFKGKLMTGLLRRETPSASVDDRGDPTSFTVTTFPFEGIVDTYSAFHKAVAQIPDTDVKVLIIAGSLATQPINGDQLQMRGLWYQVRRFSTDPATATWDCQCPVIQDPT